MTVTEACNLTPHGGAKEFATLVAVVDSFGPWCLIGGLAVNCYVEPVYTLDADLVAISAELSNVTQRLHEEGLRIDAPQSDLRIQFTTDPRYQDFRARSLPGIVLGVAVRVATLEDVTQGKTLGLLRPSPPLQQT